MTPTEDLILRGMHILMRTTFSPNEPVAQAKHFQALQADVGPWLSDYVAVQTEALEAEGRRINAELGSLPTSLQPTET